MTTKTYYFVKTQDGRYLQGQWQGGQMRFWLNASDTRRAWTACHESEQSAQTYIAAARATVGEELVIVPEAL